MTIGAVEVPQIAQLDRMLELRGGAALAENGVADGAFLTDSFAVRTYVLVIVTAEASQRVEVADIVAVRAPVDVHLREARVAEDLLQCGHRPADRRLLRRED